MRNIFVILFSAVVCLSTTSCEEMYGDFLEKAPGVDVTEDTIFSSRAQAELFLAAVYGEAMQSVWHHGKYRFGSTLLENGIYGNMAIHAAITEEGDFGAPWWPANAYNQGAQSTSNNWYDRIFSMRWTALRYVHTMLERIDDVPDADQAYKNNIKAEMRYLRAQLLYMNFKRYGGMPIIQRRFLPAEQEEMRVPRATLEATVQAIIDDCDYAAANLPDAYPSQWRGRATKGAALALKSRTLLFAASPQFNTATPILSMDDPANNILICYGNYDVNRWQLAADAAKAVIDWAPSGGVRLIEDQGVERNYRYVWEVNDNPEIILADKHSRGTQKKYNFWSYLIPNPMGGGQGIIPTQNFIEKFYDKRDGTPQTWEDAGTDLLEKYAELDYRFHQTIGHQGSFWNPQRGNLQMFHGPLPAGPHRSFTGYWVKKHIADEVNNVNTAHTKNWTWFSLNESYLNYAEALNEAQGPVPAAYEAINRIRARSGMPPLATGLTQAQFRERVRKERGVEMAYDDHRFWDIRRWLIAHEEGVANGPMYGLNIYKNEPLTTPFTFRYERYVFEERVWADRFYLMYFTVNSNSFGTNEMNKGYLVQNPGW